MNLVGNKFRCKFNDVEHCRQRTPLMAVVESGDGEQVKKMLASEVDLTATNDRGADVFDVAIQNGDPADADATVLRLLLQHGANPNLPDPNEGQKQSPSGKTFVPPLSRAARYGSVACVEAMLDHDADVNKTHGIEERSALVEVVLSTVLSDVDVAAQIAIATLLLEHGANVDHKASCGTALILAAIHNQIDMVKLLVRHGALLNKLNPPATLGGLSALHLVSGPFTNVSVKIAEHLLENGADVRLRGVGDAATSTPLMFAVYGGDPKVDHSSLLLKYGADPDEVDSDDNCLLWHSATFNHVKVTDALLANNADPNFIHPVTGCAPLDRAVDSGNIEPAALLLAHGASPSHCNGSGSVMFQSLSCFTTHTPPDSEVWIRLHQLLAVYGASSTSPVCIAAQGMMGFTSTIETAKSKGLLMSQAWFEMMGVQVAAIPNGGVHGEAATGASAFHGYWSPLRVAAYAKMYQHAASALKLGRIDPELDSFTLWNKLPEAEQTMSAADAVVADALAIRSLALSAHPPCLRTIDFVCAATSGWSPERHWLHHRTFRAAVHAVMLTNERLCRNAESNSSADPVLPPELWLHLLGFCLRQDWQVDINVGSCVEIVGLQGRADLNGKKGFVRSKIGQRWSVVVEVVVAPMPPRDPGYAPFYFCIMPQDRDGQVIEKGSLTLEANREQKAPETVSIKAANLKAVSSQHFMRPAASINVT